MTVSELEKWVTEAKDVEIDASWVKDLIADWRLMRERLLGFRDGDLYRVIADQAGDTLADLRLDP